MTKKYSAILPTYLLYLTIISCLLPSWKLDNISLVYLCGIKNIPKLYHKPYSNKYCNRPLLIYLLSSLHCLFLVFAAKYPLHEKKLTPPRLIDHISIDHQPPIRLTVAPPRLSEGLQPEGRPGSLGGIPTFRGCSHGSIHKGKPKKRAPMDKWDI